VTETKKADGTLTENSENWYLGEWYEIFDKNSDVAINAMNGQSDDFKDNLRLVLSSEKQPDWLIMKTNISNTIKQHYYIVTENGKTFESLNRS
jgi:hypothetical protein